MPLHDNTFAWKPEDDLPRLKGDYIDDVFTQIRALGAEQAELNALASSAFHLGLERLGRALTKSAERLDTLEERLIRLVSDNNHRECKEVAENSHRLMAGVLELALAGKLPASNQSADD